MASVLMGSKQHDKRKYLLTPNRSCTDHRLPLAGLDLTSHMDNLFPILYDLVHVSRWGPHDLQNNLARAF